MNSLNWQIYALAIAALVAVALDLLSSYLLIHFNLDQDKKRFWVFPFGGVVNVSIESSPSIAGWVALFMPFFEIVLVSFGMLHLFLADSVSGFLRLSIFSAIAVSLIFISWWDMPGRNVVPNVITIPGTLLGLILGFSEGQLEGARAAAGLITGLGISMSLLLLAHKFTGRLLFGGGILKLLGLVGAFLGPRPTLYVVAASSIMVVFEQVLHRLEWRRVWHVPLGPILLINALLFSAIPAQWLIRFEDMLGIQAFR